LLSDLAGVLVINLTGFLKCNPKQKGIPYFVNIENHYIENIGYP